MAQLADTTLFNDANLVSYYKAEDTADSKGANTLTNNGTTLFNAAKFNNGFDFGASNTTKSMSRASSIVDGNVDLSISFWVKLQTEIAAGFYTFAELDSLVGADRYFTISYNFNAGTRKLETDFSGSSTTGYTVTLGTSLWYHIVITRNVSGNAGKLYVDNVERTSTTIGTVAGGQSKFSIGATPTPANFSSAIIDDVGIFNKVLSVAEVNTLFTPSPVASPSGSFSFI